MATATITYTMSPSTSSIMCQTNATNPPTLPCFQRRSSIRRGTISSLSKDVRVNDFVEIIKKQKAIQQKERDVDTSSMMLRRRHSMMNMSNRVASTKKPNLPPRIRTMSNSDLKATVAAATNTSDNNASTAVTASATSPSATHAVNMEKALSGRIRLDEKNKGKCKSPTLVSQEQQQQKHQHQETVINHLRKCAACHENKKEISLASKGVSAAEAAVSSITSASFSSDNTVSSCSSLSSYKNEDTCDSHPQRSFIIKELNQCMANYSAKMDQMLNKKENNIQACKQLIAQQQELLSQLEVLDKELPPETPSHPSSSSLPPPPSSSSVDLLKSVFALRPKTQIVIRQTADKNEADTIFSLEGACTTAVNTCYIPDEIKSAASKSTTQYTYNLNLTHEDRLNKFVLKSADQWQADHQVDTCQDKQCDQGFNWFQRKHHCRGCGNIYCSTHSSNRLPLFTGDASACKPTFSRVCDSCFYQLVGHSLKPIN
ncbi:hypothetical protein MBANPS3_000566 [Mucor bainieri]